MLTAKDVVSEVRDRFERLPELDGLRAAARPRWIEHEQVQRRAMDDFGEFVRAHQRRSAAPHRVL